MYSDYEETYFYHEVYVTDNPDSARGGYVWSVCKQGVELESGLEFEGLAALNRAHNFINSHTSENK